MRFYKVLKPYSTKNWFDEINVKEGDVLLRSTYYNNLVICSDGTNKTKFSDFKNILLDLIESETIRLCTIEERDKLVPHMTKPMKRFDI